MRQVLADIVLFLTIFIVLTAFWYFMAITVGVHLMAVPLDDN